MNNFLIKNKKNDMKIFEYKNHMILALSLVSLCACSLEEDTLPFVNQETYYKNEQQVD